PSVVERTRPVKAGAPVVAAHFLGQTAVFVLGEGALMLAPRAGEPRSVPVHGGAILATAAHAERIVTGGDDGKAVATAAEGGCTTIAADAKQRWIDHVAVGPPARSPGRRAERPACARARARSARSRCRRPSAASPSRRKACASPSPTTTASRSGLRMRRASRNDCNGRAPISTWW